MILNIVYLLIGMLVGFLIKYEIDIKNQKKRIDRKIRAIANMNVEPFNETLCIIKELNVSLMKGYQNNQKKKEV